MQFQPQNIYEYDVSDFFTVNVWYEKAGNHVTGRF